MLQLKCCFSHQIYCFREKVPNLILIILLNDQKTKFYLFQLPILSSASSVRASHLPLLLLPTLIQSQPEIRLFLLRRRFSSVLALRRKSSTLLPLLRYSLHLHYVSIHLWFDVGFNFLFELGLDWVLGLLDLVLNVSIQM